jgi:flagellar biosynthetic protein FlhB
MAGDSDKEDRTEAATAQRLQRARAEGRAPLSRELGSVAVLGAAALVLVKVTPPAVRQATALLAMLLGQSETLDRETALRVAGRCVLMLAGPFILAALIVGALSVLLQTGGLMKLSAFRPDFSRISPFAGLARVLGPRNAMEAGKSLLKLAVVGAAGWSAMTGLLPDLFWVLDATPAGMAISLQRQLMSVLTAMLVAHGTITALDVVRSRFSFNAELRMTKQELRDESRENDGNPQMKGRLRQLRQQRARRRMMSAVPKATVVITNPTHFAVALAYERGSGGSPRIVAKGADEVAARIRKLASEANVPLVANPPLARALFARPLDSEIPAEHFKAVAEVIAYVWRLQARQSDRRQGRAR